MSKHVTYQDSEFGIIDSIQCSSHEDIERDARTYTKALNAARYFGRNDDIINYEKCFEICPSGYKDLAETIRTLIVGTKHIHYIDVYRHVYEYLNEHEDLGLSRDHMLMIAVKVLECIKSPALEPTLMCHERNF